MLQLALKSWEAFGADNCSQMAAAITYYVLFAVVPLAMFVVSVFGIAAGDEGNQDQVTEWVEDYLGLTSGDVRLELSDEGAAGVEARYGPDSRAEVEAELAALSESEDATEDQRALAEDIEAGEAVLVAGILLEPGWVDVQPDNLISDTLDGVVEASVPLGVIGFVTLAFSAAIAFSAIRRSLNFIWRVPHRPFAQQRIIELSMLVGLIVLLAASITATGIVQAIRELSDGEQSPITLDGLRWTALGYAAPWFFTLALVLLAYRFVANAPNRFRDVWLGAFLAATALEILKYGYGIYVVNFGSYGVIYGALGGILLFMFFIWIASYVFLFGAELAVEYPRVRRGEYDADEERAASIGLWQMARDALRGLFVARRD